VALTSTLFSGDPLVLCRFSVGTDSTKWMAQMVATTNDNLKVFITIKKTDSASKKRLLKKNARFQL
jgi:hypothetical protein